MEDSDYRIVFLQTKGFNQSITQVYPTVRCHDFYAELINNAQAAGETTIVDFFEKSYPAGAQWMCPDTDSF